MAQASAAAGGHPEVTTLVRAAAGGQHKPVYLLSGAPFETNAAAQALVDALVPAARRAFNLEVYDGRTTPIGPILDSLRTAGFFPGVKVVWVRESTLFVSGEKRGEITKGLYAAWADGREQEAAERLLTVVALAGWSQEQFVAAHFATLAKARLRDVFGED